MDAFREPPAIRDIRVSQASEVRGDVIFGRVHGAYSMIHGGRIYRFVDNLPANFPFTANVDNRFLSLAGAVKCDDETGLRQQAR